MKLNLTIIALLVFNATSFSQNWSISASTSKAWNQFGMQPDSKESVLIDQFRNHSYDANFGVQFNKNLFISRLEVGGEYWKTNYEVDKKKLFTSSTGYTEFGEGVTYHSNVFSGRISASLGIELLPSINKFDMRVLYGLAYQRDVLTFVKTDEFYSYYLSYSSGPPTFEDAFSSTGTALDHITINKNSFRQNVRMEIMRNFSSNLRFGVYTGLELDFLKRISYADVYERYAFRIGFRMEKSITSPKD